MIDARDAARVEVRARARAISRRTVRTARATRGARAGVWVALTMVILGALDVVWPVGPAGRVVFAIFTLGALWRVVWAIVRRDGRTDDARVASVGAARAGLDEEHTRSAVEFALAQPTADPLAHALEQRALERGLAALRSLDLTDAVDTAPARRWLTALGVAVAGVLVVTLVAPRAALVEMVRLADPLGDHPAYSRTRLALRVEPADLRVGDDARVVVTVDGEGTGSITLATQREDEPIERSVMSRESNNDDGVLFTTVQRNVRESLRMRAEAGRARTRWRRVDPLPKPRLMRAWATIEAPAYTRLTPTVVALPATETPLVFEGSTIQLSALCSMNITEVRAPGAEKTGADGRSAWARWRVSSPGFAQVFLDAVTAAGFGLDHPIGVFVAVHADMPPEVRVIEPTGAQVLATANARVRFTVVAQDDVGIASLNAEARASDAQPWKKTPMDIAPAADGWVGVADITPADFGVGSGGRLLVRFIARDGRPQKLGGPNRTVVGPVEIVVIGDDAFATGAGGVGSRTRGATGAEGEPADSREGAGETGGGHAEGSPGKEGENETGAPGGSERVAGEDGSVDGEQAKASDGRGAAGGNNGASTGERGESNVGANRRSSIAGRLRAIGFGSGSGVGPALDPSLLNRLNERDRGVVARYFELLASAPVGHEADRRSEHE